MVKQVQNQLKKIEELLTGLKANSEVYLNLSEAASFLKLKPSTIYKKIAKKEIPHFKIGKNILFSKSSLVKFVQSHKIKSKEELRNEINQPL